MDGGFPAQDRPRSPAVGGDSVEKGPTRNVGPLSRSSGLGIKEGTFLSEAESRSHLISSVALSTKLEAPFRLKRLGPTTQPDSPARRRAPKISALHGP